MRRAVAIVGVCLVVAVLALALLTGGSGQRSLPGAVSPSVPGAVAPSVPGAVLSVPRTAAARLAGDPGRLAGEIQSAQGVIDRAWSTPAQLAGAGLVQQLATRKLFAGTRRLRRVTLARLRGSAATMTRADLAAADALSGLGPPPRSLPPWRIVSPPPAPRLLGYFRAAQARFGVPWEDLAAIEFVETRFGRVNGTSVAGAQGPMQFLPATWATYGSGNIHSPREAILGAARYLVASGAPADLPGAIYHYNNSLGYVHAVEAYAGRMRADARAFYGYYNWQVLYTWVRGADILPVGYPSVRPVRVASARHRARRHRTPRHRAG